MSKPSREVPFVLRVVTFAWAALTLLQFTIWALVCIIGGDLDGPWWLWFAVPPAVVIGPLWWWFADRRPADDV